MPFRLHTWYITISLLLWLANQVTREIRWLSVHLDTNADHRICMASDICWLHIYGKPKCPKELGGRKLTVRESIQGSMENIKEITEFVQYSSDKRPPVKGRLRFDCDERKQNGGNVTLVASEVTDIYFSYPIKLMVPERISTSVCRWAFLVTYGGGLVEGDDINLSVEVQEKCCALLATQASTKVFHCLEGIASKQSLSFTVAKEAMLFILPDPIVCFKQAIYCQKQEVSMRSSSSIVLLDWLTAGRVARGEAWQFDRYLTNTLIYIEDELKFKDTQQLSDSPDISLAAAMQDYQVVAMMVLLGPMVEDYAKDLVDRVGKPLSYGARYSRNPLMSVSPLQYTCPGEAAVSGCVIRISAFTTVQAFQEIDKILKPLHSLMGGDPFENKY